MQVVSGLRDAVRFLSLLVAAGVLALVSACTAESPQALIASGKDYLAKNDHAAAVIRFKSALQLDPGSQEARILLGEALISTDVDAGIVELTKALNDNAPPEKVLPSLSRALLLAGDHKKLVSAYGDKTLTDPAAQAELKVNVATAWGGLGDMARAEVAAAASLAAVPDFLPAQILRARLLAGKRRFDEALSVVDTVLLKDGNSHQAWLLRGEILDISKGDTKGAEEAYRKAIAAEPSYVAAHSALIISRLRQRDISGAKAQADRMRAVLPKHPQTALLDAQLAFLDRKYVRARELVQGLLRFFPEHRGALVLGAAIEAQLGSAVQSATYLNKVLLMDPGLEIARRNLAEVEIRLGQYAKALETLKPLLQSTPPWADALALAGDASMRMGKADAAERYFLKAAELDPQNARLPTAAAMARLSGGDASAALADLQQLSLRSKETFADEALFAARMKRREYDEALVALDNMIRKDPGRVAYVEMRGRVHVARQDLVAARKAFEEALKADPAMFAAVASLAELDVREGKKAQAIERLQASVTANPKNAVALMALADLKSGAGASFDEVKALYVAAAAAAPTTAEPRLKLIDLAMRQRRHKDAVQAAQEGLAAMPWDLRLLDAAGQSQMRAGDLEQAATTFRKLATAMPQSPQPYVRLAELYAASGRRDQAESALKSALEIAPGMAEARAALLELYGSSSDPKTVVDRIRSMRQGRSTLVLAYLLEAEFHEKRKDLDSAIAALREGVAKSGDAELAARLYGNLLLSDRRAEADRFGSGWIKQHPQDAQFEYLLAISDLSRSDLRSAQVRLSRVVAAMPNHVLALNNLAWVLVKTGGKGAVEYAQRAANLMPDNSAVIDTLAVALAADGNFTSALATQKRAVELSPKDDRLRLTLAQVAIQAGDKELARKELERLQQLGEKFPGQSEVAKLVKQL